jgi:tRNA nucleotidyltransferase (CCA-adding enzyme)
VPDGCVTNPASSGGPTLDPPREVRRIAARLEQAGFETWCVGGAVRDALLGQAHADWDLATAATPAEVRKLFDRTVPHGIEFGTVGVLDRAGVMHEVTTFRRDVKHDGRHAVVEFGVSLDEDLARRDFTINAIAFSPRTGELRDPFGGQPDLQRRVIRAVGDPHARMVEDRLRALRALRFAGRFDFRIEESTWRAIRESASFLPRLSRERVHQELEKTMEQVPCPSRSLFLWRDAGAFASLIPELLTVPDAALRSADFIGTPDRTRRPERAWARLRNRTAALFADLAPSDARRTLEGLRASKKEIDWVAHAAECWQSLGDAMSEAFAGKTPDDRVLRRWAAAAGRTMIADFLRVAAARWVAASNREAPSAGIANLYRRITTIAWRDPLSVGDLAIDGGDLMEAGIPAGPAVGATLRRLLDAVIDDPACNTRDTLLARARSNST